MIKLKELEEAVRAMTGKEFTMRELASAAGVSEPTAREFAKRRGFPAGTRYGAFVATEAPNEEKPASPGNPPEIKAAEEVKKLERKTENPGKKESHKVAELDALKELGGEENEIPAEIIVAAYLKGFDNGFSRGYEFAEKLEKKL